MAVTAAKKLRDGEVVFVGMRLPLLAFCLARATHAPGAVGLFDLFALSSQSEQFPISVVEAMAAGIAVAATDVGDIRDMVAEPNRRFVEGVRNEADLTNAITVLASDTALRCEVGAANRAKAQAEYGEDAMIAAYRSIYGGALGRPAFP